MSELDPVVQKVLLEGDEEIVSALEKIGRDGARHIAELAEACSRGAGPMEALGGAIAIIEAAVSTAAVAILHFVEVQDSAVQKTAFLAEAFGATVGQLQGIEAAFAQAGVSAQVFERFANRLTVSIAQQWPEITANIRTAATAQDEAQNRIVAATLRVKEAQDALVLGADQDASKIANANLRVEQAFNKLAFAAQDAAAAEAHANQSVASSNVSLEAAEQRLRTLQGQPPSDSEKKALELKQAQLAVDNARQSSIDALTNKQKQLAEESQKRAATEQQASDSQLAREATLEQLQTSRLQRENALREARDAKDSAEERSAQLANTNLKTISGAIDGIISKNKEQAQSVDFAKVSVQNLERAIFNAASAGGKAPTGLEVLHKLTEVLSSDTDHLISNSERLALVQKLSTASLHNSGAATSELLKAMERGPEVFNKFADAAEHAFSNSKEGVENVEKFKGAFESFTLALQLVQQNLAAAASPAFTKFLDTMRESLTQSNGLLHLFVQGIAGIGAVISETIRGFNALFEMIDKAFNLQSGTAFKAFLIVLTGLVAAFAGAWAAIPAAIALVTIAVGYIAEHWDKVKAAAAKAWEVVTDNAVTRFIERAISLVKELQDRWDAFWGKSKGKFESGGSASLPNLQSDGQNAPIERARGGEVDGPGTGTSDSVFARLSRGEFVVKAAAVQAYGANLFHQLNAMSFPGFAAGGMVASPVRLAGGGVASAGSTVNLTIDGRTFGGLRGPKNVVDDLASFAVGRQTSSAGRNPSWYK